MKARVRLLLLGCLLGIGAWQTMAPLPTVAFDQKWVFDACVGATTNHVGLWDDMPSSTTEAALFYVRVNEAGDEWCRYRAPAAVRGKTTTDYPQLFTRVAVNDSASFTVELRKLAEPGQIESPCAGTDLIGSVTTSPTQDTGAYIALETTLPPGIALTDTYICIRLDDDPDSTTPAALRSAALIDDIRIWKRSSATVGWRETFRRPN
jgi:hypothetical protein